MTETPYDSGDLLNALVQAHPEVLAGEEMAALPRRWALVLGSGPGTSGRLGVSLLVDQEGVPTLVSARSADDEAQRRDIVGQVLDLAANGLQRWPLEELRATFATTQRRAGLDPDDVLADLTGQRDQEAFFGAVETNLAEGRIRMVLVAHRIPVELKRITELLNDQLTTAEVYAVELTQYRAGGFGGAVLVPAVPQRSPLSPTHLSTDVPEELPAAHAVETRQLVELVTELARSKGLGVTESSEAVGLSAGDGQLLARVDLEWGTLAVPLQRLPLEDADQVNQVLSRLTRAKLDAAVPSVSARSAVTGWGDVRSLLEQLAAARPDHRPNGHRH
ncbi:hypothetical protein [Nocardioides sp.]|uniref:hypothetical protein n=1 Tax=Nocardioides sp. TaxID=35761 RepID=UPI003D0A9BA6